MKSLIEKFDGSRHWFGVHFLRLALSAIFLWFGFSQLFDGINWVGYVPTWASNLLHLPPAMIVMGNGLFEVVLGALMAMGIMVRIVSLILALHLIPIALSLGSDPSGIRDLGLSAATLTIFFIHGPRKNRPLSPPNTTQTPIGSEF